LSNLKTQLDKWFQSDFGKPEVFVWLGLTRQTNYLACLELGCKIKPPQAKKKLDLIIKLGQVKGSLA
jgi:hypothetical protein